MSYTDDAVQAKLSGLNETQESIVTVAQWIMFHRRHADKTAVLWKDHMKLLSSSKRLNMIYLANEVVQQSRARRKEEFVNAFSPIIIDATEMAYRGASHEIQQKIRRVMEVWRQRLIFDTTVLDALEAKTEELDKTKASVKKPGLGGSLFSSSSAPSEIQPLVQLQTAVSKAEAKSKPAITNASIEFEKLVSSESQLLSPPVHASKLGGLLKLLATADTTISDSIKARKSLIDGLQRLIDANRKALAVGEEKKKTIGLQMSTVEDQKREVEDSIMRGLSSQEDATAASQPISDLLAELPDSPIQARPLPELPIAMPVVMPDVSNILASLQAPVDLAVTPPVEGMDEVASEPSTKRRRIEPADFDHFAQVESPVEPALESPKRTNGGAEDEPAS